MYKAAQCQFKREHVTVGAALPFVHYEGKLHIYGLSVKQKCVQDLYVSNKEKRNTKQN